MTKAPRFVGDLSIKGQGVPEPVYMGGGGGLFFLRAGGRVQYLTDSQKERFQEEQAELGAAMEESSRQPTGPANSGSGRRVTEKEEEDEAIMEAMDREQLANEEEEEKASETESTSESETEEKKKSRKANRNRKLKVNRKRKRKRKKKRCLNPRKER